MSERAPPSWADIPTELAGLVLRRLPAHVDRVRFAAVCPQWRAAARQGPLPPPLPLLMLPEGTAYSLPGSEPLRFPGCAGYTDACGNWLVFSGEDSFFLRDPFSNATLTLPALSRVRVRHVGDEPIDEASLPWMEMGEEEISACKIMFCSPNLIAARVTLMTGTSRSTQIAVCQPGATSWWSIRLDRKSPSYFVDMAFHQGKLYAITMINELCSFNICVDDSTGNPWVSQIQQVIRGVLAWPYILFHGVLVLKMTYLVESRGALLVVCRKIDLRLDEGQRERIKIIAPEGNRFEVFEADLEQSRWTKLTTLGDDQVLFLRRWGCRSVCVSHNDMPGNRTFFLENDQEECRAMDSSGSCSVYDMRDSKISTPLPMVSWKPSKVFATWLFPHD